ncbi:MAG: single-stranded-DNA-specific exonuclease RecJ [Candidatus Yonathbacteria bacterium]|nr:single-stranded-DNA-specific exonuclease RecJ [Candidatus Yonathbacteria bacterium]
MTSKNYRLTDVPDMLPEGLVGFPRLVAILLYNRGILDKDEAERFLDPDWERDTHDPFLLTDMDKAVSRVWTAMENGEKILIYTDYDADGIPGGVILHDLFAKLGYVEFENYMPHRHEEGYGLNVEAVEEFARSGVRLIITVDCGITDVEHVKRAHELGMDVIVTDHHLPGEELPPAYAVIDPKRVDDTYPDDMLCGAGLAFKLAQAMLIRGREKGVVDITEGWEKWLLDMVGIATVADMVPLLKENRTLAHFGMTVLKKSGRPGLRALLSGAKTLQDKLTEDDIGFTIAPRINAASRMEHPDIAFGLLSTLNRQEGERIAAYLEELNVERKSLVARIAKEAHAMIRMREVGDVIVLGDPSWRVGVLGIAANNLVEHYGKPVFLWGREGAEVIRGSARSDGTVNVVELMAALPEGTLVESGGHAFSGGFTVHFDAIHTFGDAVNAVYATVRHDKDIEERLIDATLSLDDVHNETYRHIARLAPFGMGNPKPLFLFKDIYLDDVVVFGKGKDHLKIVLHDILGREIEAIAFFAEPDSFGDTTLTSGMRADIIASVEESWFRNRPALRLRIEDVQHIHS